jgi:1-deoxy-D-xylulose-5-phosphate reductoisomerase
MKKKIIILGSTGSIGSTTLKIINRDRNTFKVILLTANKNYKKLLFQSKKIGCKNILIYDNKNYLLSIKKNKDTSLKIFNNIEDFIKTLKERVDYTMCSITGLAGLKPTLDAIKFSHNVAIANKESIICGWNFIEKYLKKYKTKFIPIDSEHFSIWSLIKNYKSSQIYKIFITASGGPFLKLSINELKKVLPKDAIKHPNWKMGKKISVDSATLMNKVFEIIEAQRIFNLPLSKFKILIHPNSYVHAIVKFTNGTTKFLIHDTTMEIPIFNSLYFDDSDKKLNSKKIDFDKINNLNFIQVNNIKFPSINFLKKIPSNISLFETVLVSANDSLVDLFLNKKITYLDIYRFLNIITNQKEFVKMKLIKPSSLGQIIKLSKYVAFKIKSLSVSSRPL